MKYSVNLPVPKGWQTFREAFEEDGVDLFSFEACAPVRDEDDVAPSLQIIVGRMPEDSCAKKSAIDTFMDVLGLDEDRDYDESRDDDVREWAFKGNPAYGFETMSDDGRVLMRNLFAEILPGVLMMLILSDESDGGIDGLMKMVEEKLKVQISY